LKKTKWLNRSLITGPYMALCLSAQEYERALAHCKIPRADRDPWMQSAQSDAQTHWLEHPKQGLVCIVTLRMKDGISGIQIACLLLHEAVHIWRAFREHIGETDPSREFEAYAIQAIAQTLMYEFSERIAT